jgi:2-iminobutanoate/2-iminopropanoate deaminase
VLANLDAVLKAAGVDRKNVVKSTIYLTNLADFETVNAIYGEFFGEHKPARTTIQVAALPKGARVEIEMIALK